MLEKAKISCFADEIDTNLNRQISLLKELNIHHIEFRSANHKGVADYSLQEAEHIIRILTDNDITVSALGSPIGKINITDDFEPHFEKFQHVCQLADTMNTPYIRMFSFYLPKDGSPENYRDEVFRRLDQMVNYAAAKNLVLLHENEKGIYGASIRSCRDLMENFYSSNFQATFDFANFIECGQDTLEAYHALKPYISYIHIKDADRTSGTIVTAGNGDGHIPEILRILDTAGYQGFLSLEPHLVDFDALQGLEQDVQKRGRTDGPEAFRSAYFALKNILSM